MGLGTLLLGRRKKAAASTPDTDPAPSQAANTIVIPGTPPTSEDDPEKKDDGQEMEPEAAEDGEGQMCPECGKSADECTCKGAGAATTEQATTEQAPEDDKSGSSSGMNHDRSGDTDMGTNDKSATPNAATLAELRAVKTFGMDKAFCVECVESGLTLIQAHEAWAEKQASDLIAANRKLTSLGKLGGEGLGGSDPVRAGNPHAGRGAGNAAVPLVPQKAPEPEFATYQEYVAHYQTKAGGGMTPLESHRKATKHRPDLKLAWLKQCQEAEVNFKESHLTRRVG